MSYSKASLIPVSEIELCAWLGGALPGERISYHRGFLAIDRDAAFSHLPRTKRAELDRLARRALALARGGLVHLLQRRHDRGNYEYLICRRRVPKAAVAKHLANHLSVG